MQKEKSDPLDGVKENNIVFDFLKKLEYLKKFWWLFGLAGIIGGLIGVWYASTKKVLYKSHITFALDEGGSGSMGNLMSIASQFGFSVNDSKDIFTGDNIIEIIKSRRLIEQTLLAIDTFNNKPYTFIEYFLEISGKRKISKKLENIHFPVNQDRSLFSYQQDSLLYKTYLEFEKEYIIAQRPDRKLSLFEINVLSVNEKFTKDFSDRLVTSTNNYYIQMRTQKAKETLDVLENRVALMKDNLNSSISRKSEVQDINLNPAFSSGQVPAQKQQASVQVYGSAYSELFKNLELARFNYLNEIPLMQIIDKADYPMEEIKFGRAKGLVLFTILAELLLLLSIWFKKMFLG